MVRRLPAMDSLRGIAAASVLLHHALECAGARWAPGGRWAVMFFFVLSGFVLALPFVRDPALSWTGFLLRRLIRLWPPVCAAVLISAGLMLAIGGGWPHLGDWWSEPVSGSLLSRCLLLSASGCTLVPPLWSLAIEARLSLVFPVLLWVTLRYPMRTAAAAIAAALCVEVAAFRDHGMDGLTHVESFVPAFAATLHYAAMFVMGILLARHAEPLARWSAGLGRDGMIRASLLGLLALDIPPDIVTGAGAALIIVLALGYARLAARWRRAAGFPWPSPCPNPRRDSGSVAAAIPCGRSTVRPRRTTRTPCVSLPAARRRSCPGPGRRRYRGIRRARS